MTSTAPGNLASSTLHIVVDDREQDEGLIASLQAQGSVVVTRRRLSVGDYEVIGSALFERKRLADFVASIEDGRLFRQSRRLTTSSMPAAIIIEGRARDLAGCEMRRECLQGAIISLSLIFRIPVLRSLGPDETAALIVYAGRQLQRQEDGWVPTHHRRLKRKRAIQLRLLCGLPGIGRGRAERLLERFASPQAVFTAEREALQEVDGIGNKTASAIRWVLE
jgi:ERCC4-type nuclease